MYMPLTVLVCLSVLISLRVLIFIRVLIALLVLTFLRVLILLSKTGEETRFLGGLDRLLYKYRLPNSLCWPRHNIRYRSKDIL